VLPTMSQTYRAKLLAVPQTSPWAAPRQAGFFVGSKALEVPLQKYQGHFSPSSSFHASNTRVAHLPPPSALSQLPFAFWRNLNPLTRRE